ncbi:hypothetical protein EJ06DRAFT_527443 [Trichodelitschia bisporula]|uniref:BAH-domain-containing protein n=1 Tax=Trichodelitschia bisporula TaxID=703511 RepID=A0A6G1I6F4_9PEZI|nr:hypothetical protein EJ06DRAFT_527443 [Trichodelitschia bisporula]
MSEAEKASGGEVRTTSSFHAIHQHHPSHPAMARAVGENGPPKASRSQSRETSHPAPGSAGGLNADRSRRSSKANISLDTSAPSDIIMDDAGAKDLSGPGMAPYGTRSRNRPGVARPNYAEDAEMEFEPTAMANGVRDGEKSSLEKSSRSPTAQEFHQDSPLPQSKRASTSSTTAWNALNKDPPIPGTSSFAANPQTTSSSNSRKRKVGGAVNNGTGSQATRPTTPAAMPSSTRRGAHTTPAYLRETNLVSFEKHGPFLRNGSLTSDDGTVYSVNDHVYLICEPPGEPYYIGRIMEFRHKKSDDPNSPVDYIRINWVYRPRDVQRMSNDTRLVYVTMHSDLCPLTSLRGKSRVLHRDEIKDLDEFRKVPDSFWFNQCFDRFIHRWYDVIPTSLVINVPENVKKALDERWRYVVVETSRVKELTSAVKNCKTCSGYCATDDSVECAVCRITYHMNCVRPPLAKKPSRGFAWACAACNRAQERKLEARRTPLVGEHGTDVEEDEVLEEEEEDATAGQATTAPSPSAVEDRPATEAEIAHAKMWQMRYLGMHCRVEDALQYDDRAIYPRASSRLGPKHQANVSEWYGRPVQLVKPVEIKKKYIKGAGNKKDAKLSKETQAAIEAEKAARAERPPYVQDEPPGYVHRGEDFPNDDPQNTAKLLFSMDKPDVTANDVDDYMARIKRVAKNIGVLPYSTDFMDRAIYLLHENRFDAEAALKQLAKTNPVGEWARNRLEVRKDLRDPLLVLSQDEKKRFEEGVTKYGSELRLVRLHVKTVSHADVVRYWYSWKKTKRGEAIWSSYGGRKNNSKKRVENDAASKLLDDIADNQDDSAFDSAKIAGKGQKMLCKFCGENKSRCWRRAPGTGPGQAITPEGKKDKGPAPVLGLCQRCARLWRKYAIQWEPMDDVTKKISQGGGKAWKRRVDEELIREWTLERERANNPEEVVDENAYTPVQAVQEPPKKKQKGVAPEVTPSVEAIVHKKKAPAPAPAPPPPPKMPTPQPPPAQPKMRQLPCAICDSCESTRDELVTCRDCRLAVHRNCYGILDARSALKWSCDPCANDRKEVSAINTADLASYHYKCALCPVDFVEQDLVEPPKISHKKKTERERERERVEKELATALAESYKHRQKENHKPLMPREALKRTTDRNWVHLLCATWAPEVRFTTPRHFEFSEGIALIPSARWTQQCKICKASGKGACVNCPQCNAGFHVGCARQAGYIFGFDIAPVKSSRREGISIVTLGSETGVMTPGIWCREHTTATKTTVHPIDEVAENGLTALQVFVQNYKQSKITSTGAARKAELFDEIVKAGCPASAPSGNRRISVAHPGRDFETRTNGAHRDAKRECVICGIDASVKWFEYEPLPKDLIPNGVRLSYVTNGVKHEVNRGSPMNGEPGHLSNGHATPPVERSKEAAAAALASLGGGVDTPSTPKVWECHQCHYLRKTNPELLFKKMEPERVEEPPRAPSPDHHRHPIQLWNTLVPQMPQPPPPHHQIWQTPNFGGPARPPQPLPPPHHPAYSPNITNPQPNAYQGPMVSHRPYLPHSGPPPHHGPPALPPLPGLPNGMHHHAPMHSPTHPPMPTLVRDHYPAPPAPMGYSHPVHHHGSPAPPQGLVGLQGPRPSTPRDAMPPQPQQQNRPAHGASASPNVRNILND